MIKCYARPLAPRKSQKRKGEISFETSPSQSDFSKFWFGPHHNVCSPGITRVPRACTRVSLTLPALHPIFSQFVPASCGSSQFIGWGCMDLSIAIVPPLR